MKRLFAFPLLLLLSSLATLSAQKPNSAYRLPQTPDMPEWATLEKSATLDISLVNELGQRTELLPGQLAAKGVAQWRFDLSSLSTAVYYCVCKTDRGRDGNPAGGEELIAGIKTTE